MNLWFSLHSNDSTDEIVLSIPAVIDEETGPREALQPVQDAELLTDRSRCKLWFCSSRVHTLNHSVMLLLLICVIQRNINITNDGTTGVEDEGWEMSPRNHQGNKIRWEGRSIKDIVNTIFYMKTWTCHVTENFSFLEFIRDFGFIKWQKFAFI